MMSAGGRLTTTSASAIGLAAGANSNTGTVSGAGAVWNAGNATLAVGAIATTTGNVRNVSGGGAVTNLTTLTLGGYQSRRYLGDGSGVSTAQVSSLINGTLYYFKVSAANDAGESADSAWASATPQAPSPAFTFRTGGIALDPATGHALITFGTQDGYEYRIRGNDDLLNTNGWTAVEPPAGGWTNATGAALTLEDTNAVGVTQRFDKIEAR